MASTTPPPPISREQHRSSSFFSSKSLLGFIDVSRAVHTLKLRHNWRASNQLRIEIGSDYNIKENHAKPWAGCRLKLSDDGKDTTEGWAIECNTDVAYVQTPQVDILPFTERMSIPIDLKIGKAFYNDNQPLLEVGLHNGKVAALLLVAALVKKQPLRLQRKEIGGFSVSVPFKLKGDMKSIPYTLQQRVEIDATLTRDDAGFRLEFDQLNPVLRMWQDK